MASPVPDTWLAKHAYLERLATFHSLVEAVASEIPALDTSATLPDWSRYLEEFRASVPLFHSPCFQLDLEAATTSLAKFVAQLAQRPLPEGLLPEVRALSYEINATPSASSHALSALLAQGPIDSAHAGLLRFFGWKVLSHALAPLIDVFAKWREEEGWLRSYCPACSALPSMGQLIGADPGQLRYLVCGCCASRWRFRRTGCPFCETVDDHRLSVLAVEDGSHLRIDYCESCLGYLKTYNGQGNERLMLSDWTSLHLDILALDRGLKRLAASLYEV